MAETRFQRAIVEAAHKVDAKRSSLNPANRKQRDQPVSRSRPMSVDAVSTSLVANERA